MKTAIMEVLSATDGMLALLDPLSGDAVSLLDEITSARTGPKFVLKQALAQNDHYKQLEASLRACSVAHSTLGPTLTALTSRFASGEAVLEEILAKLPISVQR